MSDRVVVELEKGFSAAVCVAWVLVFLVRIRFWILDQLIVADRERSRLSRWHARLRAAVRAQRIICQAMYGLAFVLI